MKATPHEAKVEIHLSREEGGEGTKTLFVCFLRQENGATIV